MYDAKVRFGLRRDGDAHHSISRLPAKHGVRGLVDRERAIVQSQRARAVA
jgi:hypothetical protein